MIARETVNQTVVDKKSYWEAMVRNRYQMPQLKQALVTIKFMQGVRDGFYWCPRSNHARHFQIASVPTKFQLAELLMEAIEEHIDANEDLVVDQCQAMMRTADLVL